MACALRRRPGSALSCVSAGGAPCRRGAVGGSCSARSPLNSSVLSVTVLLT